MARTVAEHLVDALTQTRRLPDTLPRRGYTSFGLSPRAWTGVRRCFTAPRALANSFPTSRHDRGLGAAKVLNVAHY
jgi:hypothetical protein